MMEKNRGGLISVTVMQQTTKEGAQMPNEAECARVICPFFKRLSPNGRGVVCECTVERAELMMHFTASAERASWMDAACERYGYAEACPLAKMLLMKWEDEVG